MDDFKILIYIVAGLIYIVSRAMKSSKKKKLKDRPVVPQAQPQKPTSSLEDLLREFGVDVPKEEPYNTEEVDEYVEPQPYQSQVVEYEKNDESVKHTKDGLESRLVGLDADHDDAYHAEAEEQHSIVKLLQDKDSVRNAIIVSEIFNRKY